MDKLFLNLIPAEDIRMIEGITAEVALEESKQVMVTKGEWELIDIEVAPANLEVSDASYSEIKYFVSTFTVKLILVFICLTSHFLPQLSQYPRSDCQRTTVSFFIIQYHWSRQSLKFTNYLFNKKDNSKVLNLYQNISMLKKDKRQQ